MMLCFFHALSLLYTLAAKWEGATQRRAPIVEFPSAQVIEQIIVFVGARYKHVRMHEENSSTYIPPESINPARTSDTCLQGHKHRP
jgi:hypothetical protein